MKKEHKRFIAGAVCPRCGCLDKLFIYRVGDKKFRECVNCDFQEEQLFASTPRELETRVTNDGEDQVVRIVEPKNKLS